jgi:ABC-type microcin C transport system permease subunit YejE
MTKINHATSPKSENITGYDAERYKKIGEILAILIIALSIIIGLGGFGLIALDVMSTMIGIFIGIMMPDMIRNYQQLHQHEKNLKTIVTSPGALLS